MLTIKRHCFGIVVFLAVFLCDMSIAKKAFDFLAPSRHIMGVPFGSSLDINCDTNDKSATTVLYYKKAHCTVNANCWSRKKPSSKLVKTGNKYKISNVGVFDSGYYKCHAINSKGVQIAWPNSGGLLVIPYPLVAPKIKVYPNYMVSLTKGQSTKFTCSSVLGSKLKWLKEQSAGKSYSPVVRRHKIVKKTNQRLNSNQLILTITNAQKSDSGFYKCEVTFRGFKRERFAALQVFDTQIPKIVSHSGNSGPVLVKKVKSTVKIHCVAEGYPKPSSIEWRKGGNKIVIPGCSVARIPGSCRDAKHELQLSSLTSTKVKSVLTIKTFNQKDDVGIYTCTAKNSHGQFNADINVKMPDPFHFLAGPPRGVAIKFIAFGSSLAINCNTNDPSAIIKLYHKPGYSCGKANCWSQKKPSSKIIRTGHIYNVSNFAIFDSGYYKCHANNSKGDEIEWPSAVGLLTIPYRLVPPPFAVSPNYGVPLIAGQNTKFTCSSVWGTKLHWFKVQGQKSHLVPDHKTTRLQNQRLNSHKLILTITNAQKTDSGFYKCVMNYRGLIRRKFAALFVSPGSPPKPSRGSSTTTSLKVSKQSRVVMRCAVTGEPLPKITWYKDGAVIGCVKNRPSCSSHPHLIVEEERKSKAKSAQVIIRSKLKLASSKRVRDQGVYTCRAKNHLADVLIHTYNLTFN